jgi:hypothetical protein
MVTLPGRGFDSRQLHKKVKADTPERGCSVSDERLESLLLKTLRRNRVTMRSMVSAFNCIFEAKGR